MVLFLYSTRILLYLVRVALDCNLAYVTPFLQCIFAVYFCKILRRYIAVGMSEATTLLFFVTAGWKFRPRPENPCVGVSLWG